MHVMLGGLLYYRPGLLVLRFSIIVVLFAHCLLAADADANNNLGGSDDLESLAWDFRFKHGLAFKSPLLAPLQRTFERLQAHLSEQPASLGDATTNQQGLCVDECGAVTRLTFWGTPSASWDGSAGEEPETWPHPLMHDDAHSDPIPRATCRLRRSLQPLYDACLHVRPDGSAWWHDHLGLFWRGLNTSACIRPPKPGAALNESLCRADTREFSPNDNAWLALARPVAADELSPLGAALAAKALGGAAPSLDRLLLLLGRLACLRQDAASEQGASPQAMAALHVLVAGGGPVGLMTALQARLAGARVTVWERRKLHPRTRENVVDASESDRSEPWHPGSLALMENIGLLHLGIRGMWVRPRFVRSSKDRVAQYAHTPLALAVEENEWELLHSLKELEYVLQVPFLRSPKPENRNPKQ